MDRAHWLEVNSARVLKVRFLDPALSKWSDSSGHRPPSVAQLTSGKLTTSWAYVTEQSNLPQLEGNQDTSRAKRNEVSLVSSSSVCPFLCMFSFSILSSRCFWMHLVKYLSKWSFVSWRLPWQADVSAVSDVFSSGRCVAYLFSYLDKFIGSQAALKPSVTLLSGFRNWGYQTER